MEAAINSARINFDPDQLFLLNICLAFLMFGVALDLRVDNFRQLLRRPRAPLVGLASQLLLLPLLTLGLIFLFRPPASIALGMLLVAACPGGNVSNFAVHLSGANAALSVFMTSITTLGAILVTPLYFTTLAGWLPGTDAVSTAIYVNPVNMVNTILQLILLPLSIGMFINYRFPVFTQRIRKIVRPLSLFIFVGFVIVAILKNLDNILSYLQLVLLYVIAHNAIALLVGYWFARLNRLPRYDARAIALETGIQNSGLGLILIFNFFDGLGGMALVAAFWGIWHLISAFGLAMWWGRFARLQLDEAEG